MQQTADDSWLIQQSQNCSIVQHSWHCNNTLHYTSFTQCSNGLCRVKTDVLQQLQNYLFLKTENLHVSSMHIIPMKIRQLLITYFHCISSLTARYNAVALTFLITLNAAPCQNGILSKLNNITSPVLHYITLQLFRVHVCVFSKICVWCVYFSEHS